METCGRLANGFAAHKIAWSNWIVRARRGSCVRQPRRQSPPLLLGGEGLGRGGIRSYGPNSMAVEAGWGGPRRSRTQTKWISCRRKEAQTLPTEPASAISSRPREPGGSAPCAVPSAANRPLRRRSRRPLSRSSLRQAARPSVHSAMTSVPAGAFSQSRACAWCWMSGNSSFNSLVSKSASSGASRIGPIPVRPLMRHFQCITCVFIVRECSAKTAGLLANRCVTRPWGREPSDCGYHTVKTSRCKPLLKLFCDFVRDCRKQVYIPA